MFDSTAACSCMARLGRYGGEEADFTPISLIDKALAWV